MENYEMKAGISLLCEAAASFPEDIMGAHKRLHEKISHGPERKYFGLSRPGPNGKISYFAAVEKLDGDEAKNAGLENIVLEKGRYLSISVPDYMNNIPAIGEAFQQLISQPGIDPEGWCVEWYENKNDLLCLVRLK